MHNKTLIFVCEKRVLKFTAASLQSI